MDTKLAPQVLRGKSVYIVKGAETTASGVAHYRYEQLRTEVLEELSRRLGASVVTREMHEADQQLEKLHWAPLEEHSLDGSYVNVINNHPPEREFPWGMNLRDFLTSLARDLEPYAHADFRETLVSVPASKEEAARLATTLLRAIREIEGECCCACSTCREDGGAGE